jgi:hypothetical protein
MGSPASHGVPQPPKGWQSAHGIGGSFAVEYAAAFAWNQWQLCRGISGRIHPESVAALPWNTHTIGVLCREPV